MRDERRGVDPPLGDQLQDLAAVASIHPAGLEREVLAVHVGQRQLLRPVVQRHDRHHGVRAGALPGQTEGPVAAGDLQHAVGAAVVAVPQHEVAARLGPGDEHLGIVFADEAAPLLEGFAHDDALRIPEPDAEQRAEPRRPGPEDKDRVFGPDLGDARGPESRGEDVADEERLLVAHRVGDARQPLVGMGYPHVFGLPAVDAAAQGPPSVGVRAVVHIAVAAEEALAAEGLDIDRHTVARGDVRDACADRLDHTDHLVTDGDALDGARYAAVLDMQVAGADAAQRDAHQCIARIEQYGNGFVAQREMAVSDVGTGFHGICLRIVSAKIPNLRDGAPSRTGFFSPAVDPPLQPGNALLRETGAADSAALLGDVVGEQGDGFVAQQEDRCEVAERHQRHGHVGKAPHQVERRRRPEEHHAPDQQAVEREHPAPGGDEPHVGLAVVVVADDRREGEEEDRHGDEQSADGADFAHQGGLRQLDAVQRGVGDAAEEDDEGRAGADEQRVGEDTEGLDQPLLHRMRDVGRGGDVRGRTHAGLVAEQTALDALHERRASRSAQDRTPAEGLGEDQPEHLGQPADVEQDDAQGQQDVAQGHDRDDHAADPGDAVDAAEDDEERERGEPDADPVRIEPEGPLPCGADRVALHRVEGKPERYGDQHGEQHAHPPFSEPVLHIVGRAADVGVAAAAFVELRKGRFDEGARGPHEGDDPHPEDRSGTADDDRRGHAGQVARADAAGQRYGEGLERGDVALAPGCASRRLAQHADHLAQHAELHAACPQGEPHGTAEQRRNQHMAPQNVVDAADPAGQSLHRDLRVWGRIPQIQCKTGRHGAGWPIRSAGRRAAAWAHSAPRRGGSRPGSRRRRSPRARCARPPCRRPRRAAARSRVRTPGGSPRGRTPRCRCRSARSPRHAAACSVPRFRDPYRRSGPRAPSCRR
nr:MAG TPA_asm: hypothetical protein [Caudoviricetes sp.]